MAYTILKLHKRAIMRLNDMDSIVQYIQVCIPFRKGNPLRWGIEILHLLVVRFGNNFLTANATEN